MNLLKGKALNGIIWNLAESLVGQGFMFVIGVILARILSPTEFGQIGLIAVFISVSQVFVNSGFNNALIRKQNCTQLDFSTVFFYNFAVGLIFYFLLYVSSGYISQFMNDPELRMIIRVLGVVLIIDSLTIIQRTILIKKINFKLQAKISITSSVISGIIAVILAYFGYGVWSLVVQKIVKQIADSSMFWILNKWKPDLVFSTASFKELFGFGSKLLISNLIDTIFQNIYYFIIGKFFSARDLGFYSKADEFKKLPSQNIYAVISKVSYPVLAEIQDDNENLKHTYKRLIKSTMFITFTLMFGLIALSDSLIQVLLGDKWMEVTQYLKLMCLTGMLYPLHALNLNLLQVKGRSDLFLKLEIFKKILIIPSIFAGIYFGIKVMLIIMVFNSLIAYYLNSYWSGKFIGYSLKEQLADILPSLLMGFAVMGLMFQVFIFIHLSPVFILLIQLAVFVLFTVGFSELIKLNEYYYLKNTIIDAFKQRNNHT